MAGFCSIAPIEFMSNPFMFVFVLSMPPNILNILNGFCADEAVVLLLLVDVLLLLDPDDDDALDVDDDDGVEEAEGM